MTTHSSKHKILLDENFTARSQLPLLNNKFDIKHVSHDYKHDGWSDEEVYQFAKDTKRILVTFNVKDFVDLAKISSNTGVVGVSTNMPTTMIDKKLTALFRKATKKSLLGKLTAISGGT